MLFGEQLAVRWWLGASLMVLGVALINSDAPRREQGEEAAAAHAD